jgi:chromosome segregation ATPase
MDTKDWIGAAADALTKTIDTMNQRLEFAQDQLTAIKLKLAETEKTVAAQAIEIAQLRNRGFADVERLEQNINAIQSSLTDLATSTTTLDRTFSDIREWANAFNKPRPL